LADIHEVGRLDLRQIHTVTADKQSGRSIVLGSACVVGPGRLKAYDDRRSRKVTIGLPRCEQYIEAVWWVTRLLASMDIGLSACPRYRPSNLEDPERLESSECSG
jgi:hypothetical protein